MQYETTTRRKDLETWTLGYSPLDDALDALPPGVKAFLLTRFDEQAARIATLEQQVADLTTLVVPEGAGK